MTKLLARAFLTLGVVIAVLVLIGPYEPAPLTPNVDTSHVGPDIDRYFAAREAEFADIIPGTEKRVVWAGARGQKTPWSVLYVHGFSATSEEIRPVPDDVAKGLGANLVYTRLRGHGRGGDAMAEATVQDWMNDLAEALSAARAVGQRVLVISTSTGGTLMLAAAQDKAMMQDVAGSIFVSPNFGINNPAARLLTWPAARYWLPLLVGADRSFETFNETHARYWTTTYPTVAVLPMAAMVKAAVALDHSRATVPALFMFSEADKVVNPAITRRIAGEWGGPVEIINPALSSRDDPNAHVIAGDVLSPDQTDTAVRSMLNWARRLE